MRRSRARREARARRGQRARRGGGAALAPRPGPHQHLQRGRQPGHGPGPLGHQRGRRVAAAGQRGVHHERQGGGPRHQLLRAAGHSCRCDRRSRSRAPVRDPRGDVHSVPHAQEGRGLVRAGRAQAQPGRRLLRQGPEQPRVLRVRPHRTNPATCLLVDGPTHTG